MGIEDIEDMEDEAKADAYCYECFGGYARSYGGYARSYGGYGGKYIEYGGYGG